MVNKESDPAEDYCRRPCFHGWRHGGARRADRGSDQRLRVRRLVDALFRLSGIPPADAVRIATLMAARVTKHDNDRGSITPGKLADVILVNGDPATNISGIRKLRTVVKDGVVFQSADLFGRLRSSRSEAFHPVPLLRGQPHLYSCALSQSGARSP